MFAPEPVFHSNDKAKIWERYCGFFDLSLKEFMQIQESLLMEQIELMAASPLGKKIMNGQKPTNIQQFRKMVPLTKYEDYAPLIGECQEDALVLKPQEWAHTSGRGGKFKWVPYPVRAMEKAGDAFLSQIILAGADAKGDVKIGTGSRMLAILAPRPYLSGVLSDVFTERYSLKLIPPREISEKLEFKERIALGFNMAMRQGVDIIGAIGTVLVKMGDTFVEGGSKNKFSLSMLHPAVIWRLFTAWLRSKMQHRHLLPIVTIYCVVVQMQVCIRKQLNIIGAECLMKYTLLQKPASSRYRVG
ncbi:MAG: GH3 auxin-responsive promoter family protein [Chloroflexi bacterium]|nr:GH3 auxin-responsive promoter family protein [Chloroflexota bacterium]